MVDLDIMLQDPNAIKSIISGDFTREGLDFSDVVFDEANPQTTRDQVAEIMLQSFSDVADSGYQEKQRAAAQQKNKTGKTPDFMQKLEIARNNLTKYVKTNAGVFEILGRSFVAKEDADGLVEYQEVDRDKTGIGSKFTTQAQLEAALGL